MSEGWNEYLQLNCIQPGNFHDNDNDDDDEDEDEQKIRVHVHMKWETMITNEWISHWIILLLKWKKK